MTLKTYSIRTDSGSAEIKAKNLNAAIKEHFDGHGGGHLQGGTNLRSLKTKFKKYVADGAWCFIEVDGERVVSIGSDR